VAVAAGSLHSLALDADGKVYTFGDNRLGQCGVSDDMKVSDPTAVSDLDGETVVLIGAKDSHSVAVTDEGKVYEWGRGSKEVSYVDTVANPKDLAVGSHHALLLDTNGQVYSFGKGPEGQLGLSDSKESAAPTPVETLKGIAVARVYAGSDNSFALTESGDVYVWGAGSFGKNGLGVWKSMPTPTKISALEQHPVRDIGAGMTATLFLTNKGHVFHSGAYLRDGSHSLSPSLWASASDKFFVGVAASHLHFAALTTPSKWQWTQAGEYSEGSLNSPPSPSGSGSGRSASGGCSARDSRSRSAT